VSRCSRFAVALVAALGLTGVGQARAQPPPADDMGDEVDEVAPSTGDAEVDEVEVEADVAPDEDEIEEEKPADIGAEPGPPTKGGGLVADDEDADENPLVRERRREVAHQTAIEQTEPRPPEVDVPAPEEPEWTRHLEVGADVAFAMRPFHNGVVESDIGYSNAIAWGLHAHWNALDWLRFTPYFINIHHGVEPGLGSLATDSPNSISPTWAVQKSTVKTYSFGLKVQPTLNFTDRLRAWVTVGMGWGRFDFPEMTVDTRPDDQPPGDDEVFTIRKRKAVFVEFPLGLGISWDVIDRWLAIEFESTAAPMSGQSGNALEVYQAVAPNGEVREVGPFGAAQVTFIQALGLSLIL